MSSKGTLCALVAGTALVVALGQRSESGHAPPAPHHPEKPWLSKEAADQIIGLEGRPGPLFDGITLGGRPPLPEERARVAEFARKNNVEIDFDVVDDELAAIRFGVTFGGCCGYEGAEVLALRLHRPYTGECTGTKTWLNDWSRTTEHHELVSASVHVNRVTVTWEDALSLVEVLDKADALVGRPVAEVQAAPRDRWIWRGTDRYLIEVPHLSPRHSSDSFGRRLGIDVVVADGKIIEASLPVLGEIDEMMRVRPTSWRWVIVDNKAGTWTWRTANHTITTMAEWPERITIRAQGAQPPGSSR
jgi:hypothetical protein